MFEYEHNHVDGLAYKPLQAFLTKIGILEIIMLWCRNRQQHMQLAHSRGVAGQGPRGSGAPDPQPLQGGPMGLVQIR